MFKLATPSTLKIGPVCRFHGLLMGTAVFIGALALPAACQAQEISSRSRHTVYIEGFGNALGPSINYEYAFRVPYRLRMGISPCMDWKRCWGEDFDLYESRVSLLGSRFFRHGREAPDGLEVGLGLTMKEGHTQEAYRSPGMDDLYEPLMSVYGTLLVGYRYQPVRGGLTFRIGWTPLIGLNTSSGETLRWGGISLGYGF
jgi:hypothetical protein